MKSQTISNRSLGHFPVGTGFLLFGLSGISPASAGISPWGQLMRTGPSQFKTDATTPVGPSRLSFSKLKFPTKESLLSSGVMVSSGRLPSAAELALA